MEPSAAWGPCEFQLQQADGEVWASATCGLPVDYASIDIFSDIWSPQPYVGSSSRGGQQQQQQLVDYNYYYAAAAQSQDGLIFEKAAAASQESLEVDLIHEMEMEILRCLKQQQQQQQHINAEVLEEAALNFKADIDMMKNKIHRYPPSIRSIGEWCTVPKVVAIGPCHHGKKCLKDAENAKRVAAYYCIKDSNCTVQEMYCAVSSAVFEMDARHLYSEDVMQGIGDDKFVAMMFYDACFLVMYMHSKCPFENIYKMLSDFIESNANDIDHDLMLLENQIPWLVVDAIMKKYKAVSLAKFIEGWKEGRLLDRVDEVPTTQDDLDYTYEPPHLLGLLRFHFVGRNRTAKVRGSEEMNSIPISVSAMELAEMGINLRASKTAELADMGLTKKRIFFGELSMAPLSLNDLRASMLINMAAHELCTTPDFFNEKWEDSAVCSYLHLLCMLVHREEDVQQLRKKGILRGAGFTDKKALDFVTDIQNLKYGPCYGRVMVQIESYRTKRWVPIMVYKFFCNNWKTIVTVISTLGAFIGILSAIKSLNGAH